MAFVFISCQKEEVSAEVSTTASETRIINGSSGSGGLFDGSISGNYADALARNFAKKYDDNDQSLRVAFSQKDLSAFITALKTNYNSTIIYVNFGVYGNGAKAANAKDDGRMTVFFTGNNMPKHKPGGRTNGATSDEDEFLNHGEIFP